MARSVPFESPSFPDFDALMARSVFDLDLHLLFTLAEFSSTDFRLCLGHSASSSSKYDGAMKVDSVRPLQMHRLVTLTDAERPFGWEKSRASDGGTADLLASD